MTEIHFEILIITIFFIYTFSITSIIIIVVVAYVVIRTTVVICFRKQPWYAKWEVFTFWSRLFDVVITESI